VIPPRANAEFVACMEDVLEVYTRPYDEKHPLVCMDETTKQLEDIRLTSCLTLDKAMTYWQICLSYACKENLRRN
jgi:hypothetical protein